MTTGAHPSGAGLVVAVVQARMGSARFPGKMLAPLAGRPLLDWVLRRVRQAATLDRVVLATSADAANDPLAALATALSIDVVRGDEHDVLSRFLTAADRTGARWIVRICADNPFIDAREIDRLVAFMRHAGADYAFNHLDRLGNGYADGFGAEIVSVDALRAAAVESRDPADHEHVTTFIWRHPDRFAVATFAAPPALRHPELRFDVDTPADLAALEPLAALGIDASGAAFIEAALLRRAGS